MPAKKPAAPKPKKEKISDAKIQDMLLEIIEEVDYDIYKSFLPACYESEECGKEREKMMVRMIAIVRRCMEV